MTFFSTSGMNKLHQFPIASKFFICAFITLLISERVLLISERVLLSSVVDIIVIIFQKGKLNGISDDDTEK